ncbi:MAG: Na+/H+ antiporter NhaC [Gemmatimonadales bacterium]
MSAVPESRRTLSLTAAVLPLVTMLLLFVLGLAFLEVGTELLVLVMLGAAAVAGAVAGHVGKKWDDIQRSTGEKLAAVLPAILILLSIGMLIGTWVSSGTIPMLVYYGLRMVNPKYLILTAFLATAAMSLCTGTSWGSAGTIGVALMGMAAALNAPLAPTAGAVVSGAYFGDKMSPLSDSTNISAIGAGANLYDHVQHMMYTAIPSFVIAGLVYLFAASGHEASGDGLPKSAVRLLEDIDGIYALSWLTLLPPVVVVVGIVKKIPPVLAIAMSSAVAAVLGIVIQGFTVQDALVAGVSGFDLRMVASNGLEPSSFGDAIGTLVNRGGLYSMVDTLLVVIAAFLLAGALDASGALDLMINRMLATVQSTFGLIAATMASGATMISLTSHGGVTALVVGGLFQKAYWERGLAPQNLSRSLEDSVTIVEPLMPWTVSAVFMATTLGVPTMRYMPWALFCMGGPVFSLLYAATFDRTGFGIKLAADTTGVHLASSE